MALTISNRRNDRIAVDLSGVTPDVIRTHSLDDIRRIEVYHGNRTEPLGELFEISGDPADALWRLTGDFSAIHNLGAGMAEGEVHSDGPVGRRLGAGMRGGRIEIHGSAGDWLGAEMRGGLVRVYGAAGSFVGAPTIPGGRGMTGGTILIDGDAGDYVGQRMRRGLIAVARNVGREAGSRMIAGTILVGGDCGEYPGAGMRRGSIVLLQRERQPLLPTFRHACRGPLPILQLIAHALRKEGFAVDRLPELAEAVELYLGDTLELGRGEIVLAGPQAS